MPSHGSTRENFLFHNGDWFATQDAWKKKLVASIEAMNGDELLNMSTSDLAKHYVSEYELNVPTIYPDDLVVDQHETQIDVSQDRNRYIRDRSRPHHIAGTSVEVDLPYTGNKVGFDIQPSTRNYNNPRAYVGNNVLKFSVRGANLTPESVRKEVDRTVASINEHLGWLKKDAQGYNTGLEALATEAIERRKEKLLKDKSLVSGLGFKMKQRPGASETFAAPSVRRKIRHEAPKPTASRKPYNPEPTLTDEDYEHILEVLQNMVQVMEQRVIAESW